MLKKLYLVSFILLIVVTLSFIKVSTRNVDKIDCNVNKINFIGSKPVKNIINYFYPQEKELARIRIPQINVDNPIYNFKSKLNTVDKNVMILEGSVLPDKSNSILFIAAHSGNGRLAYFKDLDKLDTDSLIYFDYNNYRYTYKVVDNFLEDKDGDIEIRKKFDDELVLTTCSPTNDDKQLIIENVLIKKEKFA